MSDSTRQFLKWRFDVNTFRLIGRELITDRITAVFELVKNCYDANARRVDVILNNVGTKSSASGIVIRDDGTGMSFEDIRDKWMVVGTGSKRSTSISPAPFNRRYVGEKGIGRFAVDKLGGKVVIRTKKVGTPKDLIVSIDWNSYAALASNEQLMLFTDVENVYEEREAASKDHGTTLEITEINETWTLVDILRLEKELEKVVSPFHPLNPPFEIYLTSNEHEGYKVPRLVKADPIKYATIEHELNYGPDWQDTLSFNAKSGKLEKIKIPVQVFGPVSFRLYYFDEDAKKAFSRKYKDTGRKIDGIKIYRDGVITTPFAEFESNPDKKRDILGIDKRLWSGFLDKVGSREVIGLVEIRKDGNPRIIDSTNRQDFVDNLEYRELKEFIIRQLKALEEYKRHERERAREQLTVDLEKAGTDLKAFTRSISELERQQPNLKKLLNPIKEQAIEIDKTIADGLVQQRKEREEYTRKENIYLSLMSLQEYAIHVSHAVRTSLGKVKRKAEFFKDRFPNPKFDALFKEYATSIYDEMNNLSKVIDFMLSYAGSNIAFEDIDVKKLLEALLIEDYRPVFENEGIIATVEISGSCVINANRKFFEDIFQNLISNSIKALSGRTNKRIKCSAYMEDDHFAVFFSDNGPGVTPGDEQRIFDIYYTTTADKGGAGLGLYIVKTRMESLKGDIELAPSELGSGATFKLTFPFKKDE